MFLAIGLAPRLDRAALFKPHSGPPSPPGNRRANGGEPDASQAGRESWEPRWPPPPRTRAHTQNARVQRPAHALSHACTRAPGRRAPASARPWSAARCRDVLQPRSRPRASSRFCPHTHPSPHSGGPLPSVWGGTAVRLPPAGPLSPGGPPRKAPLRPPGCQRGGPDLRTPRRAAALPGRRRLPGPDAPGRPGWATCSAG